MARVFTGRVLDRAPSGPRATIFGLPAARTDEPLLLRHEMAWGESAAQIVGLTSRFIGGDVWPSWQAGVSQRSNGQLCDLDPRRIAESFEPAQPVCLGV